MGITFTATETPDSTHATVTIPNRFTDCDGVQVHPLTIKLKGSFLLDNVTLEPEHVSSIESAAAPRDAHLPITWSDTQWSAQIQSGVYYSLKSSSKHAGDPVDPIGLYLEAGKPWQLIVRNGPSNYRYTGDSASVNTTDKWESVDIIFDGFDISAKVTNTAKLGTFSQPGTTALEGFFVTNPWLPPTEVGMTFYLPK